MRIFHVIAHFDLGGAERVAASIAKSNNANMEYHLVELMRGKSQFSDDFIKELSDAGIHCHRAWMPDIRFHFLFERVAALFFPLRFLYIWLRWHPGVVHCHTESPDMSVVFAMKLFPFIARRCKVVRTIHNNVLWTGQGRIGNICERFFISHKSNIAISQSVRQSYLNRFGEDTPIIYNGVGKTETKPYQHLVEGKINVIFAGRFERQKGISTLAEVLSRMNNDERYHFHIFGNGSLSGLIHSRLAGQKNVSINPPLFGLSSYLSSFDYMFMPSEFEGLSIVAIEASMAGLPNVINNCPGLEETLPEDWPLKVENNNVEHYLHIFNVLLPSMSRESLGSKAMSYAMDNFSLASMQRNYEKVYFIDFYKSLDLATQRKIAINLKNQYYADKQ